MIAIITGICILLLGIIHIVFGELSQLPALAGHTTDPLITGSTRVMIYQGGVILVGIGIVQLLKGAGRIRLDGFGAYLPVGVIAANILTFIFVGIISGPEVIRSSIPQLFIFLVLIFLMVFELRKSGAGPRPFP